jgi:hypothetical protein
LSTAAKLGAEPEVYKILVYNQLTPDEVEKTNIPIEKLIFWDITASLPGKTAVDAPHISIYWYGPHVSTEEGKIVRMKSVKLDEKYTESIRRIVTEKVGGTVSEKENGVEFKDFTFKTSYNNIVDLSRAISKIGKLTCEITLEFGKVTKAEKANSTFPKTKVLGEKALEEESKD